MRQAPKSMAPRPAADPVSEFLVPMENRLPADVHPNDRGTT
jgi:hypothetical protein